MRRTRPIRRPLALVAVTALLLVGCAADEDEQLDADTEQLDEDDPGDDPDIEPPDETDPEGTDEDQPPTDDGLGVRIEDNRFDPESIVVQVGDTVEWVNSGSNPHTVTFADLDEDSGSMASGDSFQVTFDEPGTFAYVCEIHGSMTAEVVVEG